MMDYVIGDLELLPPEKIIISSMTYLSVEPDFRGPTEIFYSLNTYRVVYFKVFNLIERF